MKKILNIAHRGAPTFAPENTLESFRKAIEFGADMVEFDVRKTKDDRLVIIHDKKVDRVTNGEGYVKDMTLDELKKLKVKNNGKIPTLEEVLELTKGKIRLDIEIKDNGIEKKVLDTVYKFSMQKDVIITSFYPEVLMKIKEFGKNIKTGIIHLTPTPYIIKIRDFFNPISTAKKINADFICTSFLSSNKSFIKKAHNAGFLVYTYIWKKNNANTMRRLIKRGVDGIITDRCDILKYYADRH